VQKEGSQDKRCLHEKKITVKKKSESEIESESVYRLWLYLLAPKFFFYFFRRVARHGGRRISVFVLLLVFPEYIYKYTVHMYMCTYIQGIYLYAYVYVHI
jgi:hypothetical protein